MNTVCRGATLQCSFGILPSILNILYQGAAFSPLNGLATVFDCLPVVNVLPFGACSSPTNPQPAVAGGKACVPVFLGIWEMTAPEFLFLFLPVLQSDSRLFCTYGGTVTISQPGQELAISLFSGGSSSSSGGQRR